MLKPSTNAQTVESAEGDEDLETDGLVASTWMEFVSPLVLFTAGEKCFFAGLFTWGCHASRQTNLRAMYTKVKLCCLRIVELLQDVRESQFEKIEGTEILGYLNYVSECFSQMCELSQLRLEVITMYTSIARLNPRQAASDSATSSRLQEAILFRRLHRPHTASVLRFAEELLKKTKSKEQSSITVPTRDLLDLSVMEIKSCLELLRAKEAISQYDILKTMVHLHGSRRALSIWNAALAQKMALRKRGRVQKKGSSSGSDGENAVQPIPQRPPPSRRTPKSPKPADESASVLPVSPSLMGARVESGTNEQSALRSAFRVVRGATRKAIDAESTAANGPEIISDALSAKGGVDVESVVLVNKGQHDVEDEEECEMPILEAKKLSQLSVSRTMEALEAYAA